MTRAFRYPRFVTSELKAAELARWAALKAAPRPEGFIGGTGWPDPEIFEWCDRVNALPGVCTLQSCAGHKHPEGHTWNGQLWLWLDAPTSRAFNGRAYRLVHHWPLIERVNRMYHDDGREIADVIFRGAGTGQLETSMAVLLGFLRELA
jgi:hypothetical protein